MKGAKKMRLNQLFDIIPTAMEHVRLRQGLYQVCAVSGIAGSVIVHLIGEVNGMLEWLLFAMIFDWITGCMVAAKGKSDKTESGGLNSKAGAIGLAKKCIMLMFVVFAHLGDVAMGVDYWRNAFIIGFIANEGLSIVENAGKFGMKMPLAVTNMIEVLKKKAEEVKE